MSLENQNNALMYQLKNHFDLHAEPFSADAAFFFEGAQRKHCLDTLLHLATFGDLVLFLTGEKGAGKSTLIKYLVAHDEPSLRIVWIDCDRLKQEQQVKQKDVIEQCLLALSIEVEEFDFAINFERLREACEHFQKAEGRRTFFIFDDADKLPKQQLQSLCAFCRDLPAESPLVMLFAGNNSLLQNAKIGSNLEQEAWWHQVLLKPLLVDDLVSYLEQALVAAGFQGDLQISELQKQQIMQIGKGLPGRINKVFPSILLEPGTLKIPKNKGKKRIAFPLMMGLAGLLIMSFVLVSYQHGLLEPFLVESDQQPKLLSDQVAGPQDPLLAQQAARLALLDRELKKQGVQEPSLTLSERREPEPEPEPELVPDDQYPVGDDSIGQPTASDQITPTTELAPVDENSADVAVSVEEIATQAIDTDALRDIVAIKRSENPVTDKVIQPAVDARHPAFRDKSWVQSHPKDAYMAQILGSYDEQTALKFIKELGDQAFDIYYLETRHKGRQWYVVFYGVYPTKVEAQAAIKASPKRIVNQKPWLRTVAGVLQSYPGEG